MTKATVARIDTVFRIGRDVLREPAHGVLLASRVREGVPYIGCFIPNLGDVAVFQAIQHLFENTTLIPVVRDAEFGRFRAARRLGVDLKGFCLGGGTLINSPQPLCRLIGMQKLGLRGFSFGTGVRIPAFWDQVPGYPKQMKEWINCLRGFRRITVRGPLSQEVLLAKGLENIEIIGDPALQFWRSPKEGQQRTKRIGVNVGKNLGRVWGNDEEGVIRTIFDCCQRLLRDGFDLTVITVSESDHQVGADFVASLNGSFHVTHEAIHSDIDEYLKVAEGLDALISYKLHAAILAMCRSVPVVSVEYQPKCLDFMRSMGLDMYNLRADALTADNLFHATRNAIDAADEVKIQIDRKANEYIRKQLHVSRQINRKILSEP